jgi:hypothetical protein
MGFPDYKSDTLTWAVPTSFIDEDGVEKWEIPSPEKSIIDI